MDRRIRALLAASGDVVVVATVSTFKPYADIQEYAVKMFENGGRGIGAKGKDNGLLIVVAVDDRRVKIEVGYDLEQFITDGFAGETIRAEMTPDFRNGNYGAGLLAGATRIINRVAEAGGDPAGRSARARVSPLDRHRLSLVDCYRDYFRDPQQPATSPSPDVGRRPLERVEQRHRPLRRRRGRRVWWGFGGFGGGGGGGGGFGGFGGGRSGGGGASGGW